MKLAMITLKQLSMKKEIIENQKKALGWRKVKRIKK